MSTPTRFVEHLATGSGAPMFGEETRAYLRACRLAAPAALAPYRTDTCPECEDIITGDGFVLAGDGEFAHVVQAGAVLLGCEGFWVVSPAAVGLPLGNWEDWRDGMDIEAIGLLTAARIPLDPGMIAAAAICLHQKISPPARRCPPTATR